MNASRQTFVVSAVICIAMGALFAARYRLAPYPVEAPFVEGMPLAAWMTRVTVESPWVAVAAGVVMLLWTLLLLVQMTVKYGPAGTRNYLPAQIFLIVWAGVVVSGEALAALVCAWLFTMALRQLVFSFHKDRRFGELFHAGFYLGVLPLLYAPAVVVVPVAVLTALVVYRRSGREAVVAAAGLLLPYVCAEFVEWAVSGPANPHAPIYDELWRCLTTHRELWDELSPGMWIVVALVAVFVSMGAAGAVWMSKRARKTPAAFMRHGSITLAAVGLSALVPGTSVVLAAMAAVVCALMVPYAFAGHKVSAGVATAIYALILAAVLALDLLPVLGVSVL